MSGLAISWCPLLLSVKSSRKPLGNPLDQVKRDESCLPLAHNRCSMSAAWTKDSTPKGTQASTGLG